MSNSDRLILETTADALLRTLGSASPFTELNLIFRFREEIIIFFLIYLLKFKGLLSDVSKFRWCLLSSALFSIF